MNHEDFTILMSLKLDNALNELDEERLNQHLETCETCQEQWASMQSLDKLFTAPAMLPAPNHFAQDVMWQIQRRKTMKLASQGGIAAIAILLLLQVVSLPWIISNLRQMRQASFWTAMGTNLNQYLLYVFSLFEWLGRIGAQLVVRLRTPTGQIALVTLMSVILCLVVLWLVAISKSSLKNNLERG